MTETKPPSFDSATPVLKSADYPRARTFYTETLGFELREEAGDPARFGIFTRGRARVFVDAWHGGPRPIAGCWDTYFAVTGLDAILAELSARGAPITRALEITGYGMREFEVTDPDGNVLCFGKDA